MTLRTHLDLTKEELFALGKHLGRGPLWTMSPRITVRQAISLKTSFYRALPPYTLPELESPLCYAMRKINRASEVGCVHHQNVHDMFFTMVKLGGPWISLDDPVSKDLGFSREDGSMRQAVCLTRYREAWGMTTEDTVGHWTHREWEVPWDFRQKMKTPEGREEVARILSNGEHGLEFPYEDDVPLVVHRYIENEKGRV